MFLDEARLLARLSHPNIAQTYAKEIVALYNQAIGAGRQMAAAPPGTIPSKSDTALAVVGVAAILTGGFFLARTMMGHKRGRR